MRKMSKFFAANNKNLRTLIEELTKRDIESTNRKINAVITQQKGDKNVRRHIKTEQIDQSFPLFDGSHQEEPSRCYSRIQERRNKQNATAFTEFSSKRGVTTEKKKSCLYQPDDKNQLDHKQMTRADSSQKKYLLHKPQPTLFRVSKRSSIQNGFSVEQVNLSRKSSHTANLTVIQELRMHAKPSKENVPLVRSHKHNTFFKE